MLVIGNLGIVGQLVGGQLAHRRAFLGRQQRIQRFGLLWRQVSGQLIGYLALGKCHCRRDQTLDDGSARSNDLSSPQLVHQREGLFDGRRGLARTAEDQAVAELEMVLVAQGRGAAQIVDLEFLVQIGDHRRRPGIGAELDGFAAGAQSR